MGPFYPGANTFSAVLGSTGHYAKLTGALSGVKRVKATAEQTKRAAQFLKKVQQMRAVYSTVSGHDCVDAASAFATASGVPDLPNSKAEWAPGAFYEAIKGSGVTEIVRPTSTAVTPFGWPIVVPGL